MPRAKKAVQVSAGPYPTAPIIAWMMDAPLGEIESLQGTLASIYQHRKSLEFKEKIKAGRAKASKATKGKVAEVGETNAVAADPTATPATTAPVAKKSHKKQAAGAATEVASGFGGKPVVAEDPTQAAAQAT